MTTTATKVTTKWDLKKTQEATAHMLAATYMSAFEVLNKFGAKAHEEFDELMRKHKVDHFKKLGVKTPIDLAKAIAETDHNLYGSEIEVSGDEKRATVKYLNCGMWNATQKMGNFTPEQQKQMGEHCQASWTKIAKEFGFDFEPKMDKESFEMTFSK